MRSINIYIILLVSSILLQNCSSTHKLSEVPYTDLSQTPNGFVHPEFPSEIADSLGWGNLANSNLGRVNEEFRISITSNAYPYHLFRIEYGRKVNGQSILYWPKSESVDVFDITVNMSDYLQGTCKEILETNSYEYCEPLLLEDIDWGKVYESLEENDMWTIPDYSELDIELDSSNTGWNINTQVRLGDYYRTFHHISPDRYGGTEEALKILAASSQLRTITNQFSIPENFNSYRGITSGIRGTDFILCESNEVWRFNGNLRTLLTENGFPTVSNRQDDLLFYLDLKATVNDEWYAQRANGYSKVITPIEINSISMILTKKCPSYNNN